MVRIGILNLQGDVSEHFDMAKEALKELNTPGEVIKVKTAEEASKCNAIIISGGESTVIGKLMEKSGIKDTIIQKDIPIMGTCAGMILLSKKTDYDQSLLGLINMEVKRNAFGRQKASFEDKIDFMGISFPGVFIRAPYAEKVDDTVDVLSRYKGKTIAIKKGKHIATAFHPELTNDTRIHKYFIKEALNCAE